MLYTERAADLIIRIKGATVLKYENAKDIFPEDLLRQIQRYVSGKLIYIPALEEKKS